MRPLVLFRQHVANILNRIWRAIVNEDRGAQQRDSSHVAVCEEAELQRAYRQLIEAWGEEIDARERLHDVPGFNDPSHSSILTEQELRDIRQAARLLCQADETACGILGKLTNYVIRTGFTYTAEAEKSVNVPAGLIDEIQAVVDEFRDLNDFDNDLDREIFSTSHEDGDLPIALYCDSYGQTRLRTIDADQVATPKEHPQEGRDNSFGVETSSRDVQSVYGYHVKWPDGWDYLEAERVEHIKLNVRRTVKRGLSDFYPVQGTIRDASKLLRNMSRGAQIQAAIAFIREHAAGTKQAGVSNMVAGLANVQRVATYQTGSRTEYGQIFRPGKIVDVAEGQKYYPGPMGQSNAPIFIQVLQAGWRGAAQRWSMPEYMVSSDASNANFSSTLVAGDPFVTYCEQQQAYFATRFLRLIWKALRNANGAGRFASFGVAWSDILRLVDVKAVPPDVAIRDREKETNRRNTLYQQRVISLKQWRQEENYDPDEMAQQTEQEPGPASFAIGAMPSVCRLRLQSQPLRTPPPTRRRTPSSDRTSKRSKCPRTWF